MYRAIDLASCVLSPKFRVTRTGEPSEKMGVKFRGRLHHKVPVNRVIGYS